MFSPSVVTLLSALTSLAWTPTIKAQQPEVSLVDNITTAIAENVFAAMRKLSTAKNQTHAIELVINKTLEAIGPAAEQLKKMFEHANHSVSASLSEKIVTKTLAKAEALKSKESIDIAPRFLFVPAIIAGIVAKPLATVAAGVAAAVITGTAITATKQK